MEELMEKKKKLVLRFKLSGQGTLVLPFIKEKKSGGEHRMGE